MEKYDKKIVVHRPWGKFEQFCINEKVTIKIHTVKPNESMSLQYHDNRSEFMKILKGKAKITIGDKIIDAKEGEEFFIPIKVNHRIASLEQPLEVLEIAFGDFDENDIVRLEDKYNRNL